jgi:hypothetical protein
MNSDQILLLLWRNLQNGEQEKINSIILENMLASRGFKKHFEPIKLSIVHILGGYNHQPIIYLIIYRKQWTHMNLSYPIKFDRNKKKLMFQDGSDDNTNHVSISIFKSPSRENQYFISWPIIPSNISDYAIVGEQQYHCKVFSGEDLIPFMNAFFIIIDNYEDIISKESYSELLAWKNYVLKQ